MHMIMILKENFAIFPIYSDCLVTFSFFFCDISKILLYDRENTISGMYCDIFKISMIIVTVFWVE